MKNYEEIKDSEYYTELQATLRSYDTKLWQIPGLFIIVVSFFLERIDFNYSLSLKKGVFALITSIFLWILILLYNKAHIFNLSIQKKVNEFDNKYNNSQNIQRIPLISMTNNQFEKRINELEAKFLENSKSTEAANFNCVQKWLAKQRVSSWIRRTMILMFIASSIFSLCCFFSLF